MSGLPHGTVVAALRAAAAAPSVHNTQPWLFRVTGTAVEVLVDRSRQLAVLDQLLVELTTAEVPAALTS